MLLLLFQNIRTLLIRRTLSVHFLGSVNEINVVAGGTNALHYLGTVTELKVV